LTKRKTPVKSDSQLVLPVDLLNDVRQLIIKARDTLSHTVNSTQVQLYWSIGKRIKMDVLKNKRAQYGKAVVESLSLRLIEEFGKGFNRTNLFDMLRFAETFPENKIVRTLCGQLSWSHFRILIYLKDDLKRTFYSEMCRLSNWNVRTLREKINLMAYERSMISKKPEDIIEKELAKLSDDNTLTPDIVFQDPYFLDFLGLEMPYNEKDLENAILREMEKFILELGAGFSFIARQKRITIEDDDHYIDLLFYNRKLERLVVIELKIGKFKAAYKGQMELYLRWLEKYEMQQNEKPPIGLILCADKSDEYIELLQLDKSGIRVASYLTDLPPRQLLEKKLHNTVQMARERFEHKKLDKKKIQKKKKTVKKKTRKKASK